MAEFAGARNTGSTGPKKAHAVSVSKCANLSCVTPFRFMHEGKLFRADVEIGNLAGQRQRKTQYVWLCARCAETMEPKIEVDGNTVRLSLCPIPGNSTRH